MHEGQSALYIPTEVYNKLAAVAGRMNAFARENSLRKRGTGTIVSYGDIIGAMLMSMDEDDLADALQQEGLIGV